MLLVTLPSPGRRRVPPGQPGTESTPSRPSSALGLLFRQRGRHLRQADHRRWCPFKEKQFDGRRRLRRKTLAALGMGTANTAQSSGRRTISGCWRMISAEARGEPTAARWPWRRHPPNRVKHPSFPNTISGVLYQPGAFSSVADGQFIPCRSPTVPASGSGRPQRQRPLRGHLFLQSGEKHQQWIFSRETILTIGDHVFAK